MGQITADEAKRISEAIDKTMEDIFSRIKKCAELCEVVAFYGISNMSRVAKEAIIATLRSLGYMVTISTDYIEIRWGEK